MKDVKPKNEHRIMVRFMVDIEGNTTDNDFVIVLNNMLSEAKVKWYLNKRLELTGDYVHDVRFEVTRTTDPEQQKHWKTTRTTLVNERYAAENQLFCLENYTTEAEVRAALAAEIEQLRAARAKEIAEYQQWMKLKAVAKQEYELDVKKWNQARARMRR
jgi:hypothetical protein